MTTTRVFVYDTLQHGYPLSVLLGEVHGEPVGRYQTVEKFPLLVLRNAVCFNPRCRYVHRVCTLLDRPGEGHRVEGDLYELDDEQLRWVDADQEFDPAGPPEEQSSVRRKIEVEPVGGGEVVRADVHFEAGCVDWWLQMLEGEQAEAVVHYTIDMAKGPLKQCCVDDPDHDGPHDVPNVDGC